MSQDNLLKFLPPVLTILVADLMGIIYYVIFVDAFVLMAVTAVIVGTLISLFLNGWDYKSLLTKPTAAFTLASVGLFVGLEFYYDFMWFPVGLVVVFALVGAALPWIAPTLTGIANTQRGKQKQTTTAAVDNNKKTKVPGETAEEAAKNAEITNWLVAFVLFEGNGNLFYGLLGLGAIVAASALFFSFVTWSSVTFWVYILALMIALMVMRLITTQQRKETTDKSEGGKEDKADQPNKKRGD